MEWLDARSDRFWKSVLILGILLNVAALFTSELGLDTHVHLAYESSEDGFSLPWGETRPDDPLASDPTDSSPDDVGMWTSMIQILGSVLMLKIFAALCILALVGLTYGLLGERAAAIVAIHPTFIFATGRVYPEPLIALLMLFLVVILVLDEAMDRWWLKMLTPAPVLLILLLKGLAPEDILESGVVLIIALPGVWFFIDHRITRNPKDALLAGMAFSALFLIIGGATIASGTLSIIREEPLRFISAIPIAILDVIGIYALIGFAIWPFIVDSWKAMQEIDDHLSATLAFIIGAFASAITIYVAVLWTFESTKWGSPWPWTAATLGNNGRYISLLIIPVLFLLARTSDLSEKTPSFNEPMQRAKPLLIAILLILPLAMLAGLHGQQMWTTDAATMASNQLEDGEDFLLVTDSALGMHWLYTMHEEIDGEHDRNITGYWRADTSDWINELHSDRSALSGVQVIIIAEDIEYSGLQGFTSGLTASSSSLFGGGEFHVLVRDS